MDERDYSQRQRDIAKGRMLKKMGLNALAELLGCHEIDIDGAERIEKMKKEFYKLLDNEDYVAAKRCLQNIRKVERGYLVGVRLNQQTQ